MAISHPPVEDVASQPTPIQAKGPGELLHFLFGGSLLAGCAAAVIAYSVYHGWYTAELSRDWAYAGIGVPYAFFVLGVYLFAYAWEGRDISRAVRLTMFVAIGSLVAIAVIIVVFVVLKGRGSDKLAKALPADVQSHPLVGTAISFLGDDEDDEDGGGSTESRTQEAIAGGLFTILCGGCGARFAPVPPAAACPYCGVEALPGASGGGR